MSNTTPTLREETRKKGVTVQEKKEFTVRKDFLKVQKEGEIQWKRYVNQITPAWKRITVEIVEKMVREMSLKEVPVL